MKKWILLLLCLSLLVCMAGCGEKEPENIVEDLEGPEGIELFAGLWYCEHRDLWVEIYYDGTWCSFEDGGLLRAYGSVTIAESVAVLEPKEGEESWSFTSSNGKLTDDLGYTLFQVTEVGVRKPLIVNELGVPDVLPEDETAEGRVSRQRDLRDSVTRRAVTIGPEQ